MEVLQAADVRLLVMDPSLAAVRDAARILKLLEKGAEAQKTLVVLNRVRPGGRADVPLDKINEFIDHPIDLVVPFDRKKLALASLNGEPVARRKSPVTDAYQRLAAELVGHGDAKRRHGWLAGLMGG